MRGDDGQMAMSAAVVRAAALQAAALRAAALLAAAAAIGGAPSDATAKPKWTARSKHPATPAQTVPLDQFVAEQKGCERGWKTLEGERFVIDWPKSSLDGALLVVARCNVGPGQLGVGVRLLDGTSSFSTELAVNGWAPDDLNEVLVRDVNGDKVPDIVLAATAITGAGPTGAQPFPVMDALISTPETSSTAIYRAATEAERKAMERAKTAKAAGVRLATAIRQAAAKARKRGKSR